MGDLIKGLSPKWVLILPPRLEAPAILEGCTSFCPLAAAQVMTTLRQPAAICVFFRVNATFVVFPAPSLFFLLAFYQLKCSLYVLYVFWSCWSLPQMQFSQEIFLQKNHCHPEPHDVSLWFAPGYETLASAPRRWTQQIVNLIIIMKTTKVCKISHASILQCRSLALLTRWTGLNCKLQASLVNVVF